MPQAWPQPCRSQQHSHWRRTMVMRRSMSHGSKSVLACSRGGGRGVAQVCPAAASGTARANPGRAGAWSPCPPAVLRPTCLRHICANAQIIYSGECLADAIEIKPGLDLPGRGSGAVPVGCRGRAACRHAPALKVCGLCSPSIASSSAGVPKHHTQPCSCCRDAFGGTTASCPCRCPIALTHRGPQGRKGSQVLVVIYNVDQHAAAQLAATRCIGRRRERAWG